MCEGNCSGECSSSTLVKLLKKACTFEKASKKLKDMGLESKDLDSDNIKMFTFFKQKDDYLVGDCLMQDGTEIKNCIYSATDEIMRNYDLSNFDVEKYLSNEEEECCGNCHKDK